MEIKGLWPRATGAAVVAALAVAPVALATGGDEDKDGKGSPPPHAQNEHAEKSQASQPEPQGPPATPPGQAKKEQHAAQPAAPAPRKAAKPKKAKPTKTKRSGGGQRKGDAPKQAAPATVKAKDNGKGKAKTTICHATGSETNPYVTITIPEPAVRAHARHQDGRDIIPAPASGCPKPAAADPVRVAAQSVEKAVAIVTGGSSTTPPPAPAAAPAAAAAADPVPPIGTSSMIASGGPAKASRGVAASSDSRGGEQDTLGVIGEIESGGDEGGALPAAQTTSAGDAGGSLPFTGMQLALLALVGAGVLLTGVALRRASQVSRSRPTSG